MVFFFKSGGSSQKFTVTINYKSFTFTAETGKTASHGSGYLRIVPSTSGRYRFQFIKNYTIKSKKIMCINIMFTNIHIMYMIRSIL